MIHPALIEGQHYEPNSSMIDHVHESSVDSEANNRMKLIAYDYNSSVSILHF